MKDAANLQHIVAGLRERGCGVPIVADIHFKPDAAMEAAKDYAPADADPAAAGAEAQAAPKRDISVDYEIGDSVKVLDGPFASFNGIVEELDFDKAKVKVGVSIFGRATPVELDFEQVELAK